MPETEIKIRHVSYPIKNEWGVFKYNLIEGLGRGLGWALTIGGVFIALTYLPDAPKPSPEAEETGKHEL